MLFSEGVVEACLPKTRGSLDRTLDSNPGSSRKFTDIDEGGVSPLSRKGIIEPYLSKTHEGPYAGSSRNFADIAEGEMSLLFSEGVVESCLHTTRGSLDKSLNKTLESSPGSSRKFTDVDQGGVSPLFSKSIIEPYLSKAMKALPSNKCQSQDVFQQALCKALTTMKLNRAVHRYRWTIILKKKWMTPP